MNEYIINLIKNGNDNECITEWILTNIYDLPAGQSRINPLIDYDESEYENIF